jgi:hypothetical protein
MSGFLDGVAASRGTIANSPTMTVRQLKMIFIRE